MSIFHRDLNNPEEFVRIKLPVVKGDQGERGEKGEQGIQGARGERGVYVGDELSSFPEDQLPDLWIQPVFDEEDMINLDDVYLKEEVDALLKNINTEGVHTHKNLAILDNISDSSGSLTYKGQPIAIGDGFNIDEEYSFIETSSKTLYGAINELNRETVRFVEYNDDTHLAILPNIDQRMDTLEGQFMTLTYNFNDLKDYVKRTGGGGNGGSSGSNDARDITITDAGGYFSGYTVESALQELGNKNKTLTTKVTDVTKLANSFEHSIQTINQRFEEMDSSFEEMVGTSQTIRTEMTDVLRCIQSVNTDLFQMQEKVEGLDQKYSDLEDYFDFKEHAEYALESHQAKLSELDRDLTSSTQNLQMSLGGIESNHYALEREVQTLEKTIRLLEARIVSLETSGSYVPMAILRFLNTDSNLNYINQGETFQIEVELLPSEATNQALIWETTDDCCEVENGLVRGVRQGLCTVRAMSADREEVKAEATFQVFPNDLD